jgi:hypothetical protein
MNIRLFNNDGGEMLTSTGNEDWASDVHNCIKKLVDRAVENGVSLRDLTSLVLDEITCLTAEARVLKGIRERRAAREANKLYDLIDRKSCKDFYPNLKESYIYDHEWKGIPDPDSV